MGESASHIITFSVSHLCKFFKFINDQIVAALAVSCRPHLIMDLSPPVNTKDHVGHLTVCKLHHFVIQKDAVGRQSKPELFTVLLLQRPAVSHQLLYDLKVHQRLSSKEIHFQVSPAA